MDLSYNRFTGTVSQQILTMPQLLHINVSMNLFSGIEVINFIGIETHLQDIDAQGNILHGRLPANLVTISNLTYINLARNDFTGQIPREYGLKVGNSWKSLFLDHNFLTGYLPPEFRNARMRMKGSLANNCLRCPTNVTLCNGGQRPTSECVENDRLSEDSFTSRGNQVITCNRLCEPVYNNSLSHENKKG